MTTRITLEREIARSIGDLVIDSAITTGGSTTEIVDTSLIMTKTDQLAGYYMYIYGGTGIGNDRIITAFTPASDKAVVTPACSPTPATADTYIITKRFRHSDYTAAIDAAIDELKFKASVLKYDKTIRIGDILSGDAEMERWASGASSAPDSSTLNGTGAAVARESTIVDKGSYSAKLTNQAGQAAYLEYSIAQYLKYASKTFNAKVRVYSATASRARIALTDGVTTTYSASYHTGGSGWELLTASHTLSASPTALKLQLRIETGTSISVYFDNGRLTGSDIYDYKIPSGFISIHEITKDRSDEIYTVKLEDREWRITASAGQPYLHLEKDYISYTEDYALWIEGAKQPAELTADSTTVDIIHEIVKAGACVRLLTSKFRPEDMTLLNFWLAQYDKMKRDLGSRIPSNSRPVEQL